MRNGAMTELKRYKQIAQRFSVGRGMKEHFAQVIASPEAIYFVISRGLEGFMLKAVTCIPLCEVLAMVAGEPLEGTIDVLDVRVNQRKACLIDIAKRLDGLLGNAQRQ